MGVEGRDKVKALEAGAQGITCPGDLLLCQSEHPWHVLVEAASGDPAAPLAETLERLLGEAIEAGLVVDAVIAASGTAAA